MGDEADADWQAGLSEWGEDDARQAMGRPPRRRRNEYPAEEYRQRRAYAASSALSARERKEWDLP